MELCFIISNGSVKITIYLDFNKYKQYTTSFNDACLYQISMSGYMYVLAWILDTIIHHNSRHLILIGVYYDSVLSIQYCNLGGIAINGIFTLMSIDTDRLYPRYTALMNKYCRNIFTCFLHICMYNVN